MNRLLLPLATLLLASVLAAPAPAGTRETLEAAVLSLGRKPYVSGETRPTTDGTIEWAAIRPELAILARHVPRWSEALRLYSVDSNHVHSVGEHGLRALYHYARSAHARAVAGDRNRLFLGSLTVLLHDMGKLDSPRDARGRQRKDPGHPGLCAVYMRAHGRALGLLDAETEWSAQMLLHHRDLGVLERANREPEWAKPEQVVSWRKDLAAFLRTRSNLDFLAALTEADVRGINGGAYDEWELAKRLPIVTEETWETMQRQQPAK